MEGDENVKHLTLTWNEFGATYQQVLNNLRLQNNFTDVTLACENGKFPAHKLVLVTCSDFFKSILEDVRCDLHPIIFLRGVQAREMQVLIEYMYRGTIEIPNVDLPSLMETAQVLQIKGLGTGSEHVEEPISCKRMRTDFETGSKKSNSPYGSRDMYSPLNVHNYSARTGIEPLTPKDTHQSSYSNVNRSTKLNNGSILNSLFTSSQPSAASFEYRKSRSPMILPAEVVHVSHEHKPSTDQSPTIESIEVCALSSIQDPLQSPEQALLNVKEEPLDCSQSSSLEKATPTSKDNIASQMYYSIPQPVPDENAENESRPYVCPICQKNFAKASILKRHHLAHFRPYACKLCERSFTRREVLTEHVLEHNGADLRLPCPVCHMTIKRKRNLQAHIKVKHPEYYQQKKAGLLNDT